MEDNFAENTPKVHRNTPKVSFPLVPVESNIVPVKRSTALRPDIIILNKERSFNIPPEFWFGILNALGFILLHIGKAIVWTVRNIVILSGTIIFYVLMGLSEIVKAFVHGSGGSVRPFDIPRRTGRSDGSAGPGNKTGDINININSNNNN